MTDPPRQPGGAAFAFFLNRICCFVFDKEILSQFWLVKRRFNLQSHPGPAFAQPGAAAQQLRVKCVASIQTDTPVCCRAVRQRAGAPSRVWQGNPRPRPVRDLKSARRENGGRAGAAPPLPVDLIDQCREDSLQLTRIFRCLRRKYRLLWWLRFASIFFVYPLGIFQLYLSLNNRFCLIGRDFPKIILPKAGLLSSLGQPSWMADFRKLPSSLP